MDLFNLHVLGTSYIGMVCNEACVENQKWLLCQGPAGSKHLLMAHKKQHSQASDRDMGLGFQKKVDFKTQFPREMPSFTRKQMR